LDKIQELIDDKKITDTLDFSTIVELGLAGNRELVKILGRGELKSKLTITAHKFSATAKQAIEAAGGEAVEL
jgi:large subunit ribosomal protein L15